MPQSKSKRSRYTPPAPKKAPPSKLWVPATMFTCLALGIVVIGGNYLELLPGGDHAMLEEPGVGRLAAILEARLAGSP